MHIFRIRNSKKGYTLLELLTVIAIIVILVGFGTASYSSAQKKARDAKRKGDLRTIQNALEQYFAICGSQYPFTGAAPVNLTGTLTCAANASQVIKYPVDPLNSSYLYQCLGTCSSTAYTICPSNSVNGGKRLETEDCSDGAGRPCCLSNQQ